MDALFFLGEMPGFCRGFYQDRAPLAHFLLAWGDLPRTYYPLLMQFIKTPLLLAALSAPLAAQTTEDFETYPVAFGGAVPMGVSLLDSSTIDGGFGPGLVEDGCSYSTNGPFLQWNGNGFFGQTSRNICGAGLDVTIEYDTPVTNVSFDIMVFDTAPDVVTIEVLDVNRVLIQQTTGITVVDGSGVPFSYNGPPAGSVKIIATQQPSSPIVDNHEFGGPNLTITGPCPGAKALSVVDATPNGPLAIAHGSAGSFVIPGGACAGLELGIAAPTLAGVFNASPTGTLNLNFNANAAMCGRTVQVVDLTMCLASQTAVL